MLEEKLNLTNMDMTEQRLREILKFNYDWLSFEHLDFFSIILESIVADPLELLPKYYELIREIIISLKKGFVKKRGFDDRKFEKSQSRLLNNLVKLTGLLDGTEYD